MRHAGGTLPADCRWGPVRLAGRMRFRLWAPALSRLSLRLDGRTIAMSAAGGGWYETEVEEVAPGAAYCFVLEDGREVPDPASRAQKETVHGPSLVVDPQDHSWQHAGWTGRPWREAIVYELHVGTFTEAGTFRAAAGRLAHLADLGVTAVELMPIAHFAGSRGWGYDGVLPYAPHPAYGTPRDLKHLVDTAHGLGLMVLLDVVYNHFGPEGNHLSLYAPRFFDPERITPWGSAIDFTQDAVRRFFIDNAQYWLDEFRFDGLRLDAIDQIFDASEPHILAELAGQVRARFPDRRIHLVTEDSRNVAHLHRREDGRPRLYTAEWNDDFHNAAHVLLTGETDGYYADFAEHPHAKLARCLAEGFAYQGEASGHAGGKPRGQDSTGLPTTAFVNFLQNHDQTGNRAFGDRLTRIAPPSALEALTAILLLSPQIPLLFMGEEWGETRPFLFFTDFEGDLADAVREGRRREFAQFTGFLAGEDIPDPNAAATFAASKPDWAGCAGDRLELFRSLLFLRRQEIIPRLDDGQPCPGEILPSEPGMIIVQWQLRDCALLLAANLSDRKIACPAPTGRILYRSPEQRGEVFAPWTVLFSMEAAR